MSRGPFANAVERFVRESVRRSVTAMGTLAASVVLIFLFLSAVFAILFTITVNRLVGGTVVTLMWCGASYLVWRRLRRRSTDAATVMPRADSLEQRISQVQDSLQETGQMIEHMLSESTATLQAAFSSTTNVVDDLQAELRTRRAALDNLAAQARAAEQRADQARALAAIEQSSAEAVDTLLNRRLAEHLATQERAGHRWDLRIMLSTLALGVPFGIATGVAATLLLNH